MQGTKVSDRFRYIRPFFLRSRLDTRNAGSKNDRRDDAVLQRTGEFPHALPVTLRFIVQSPREGGSLSGERRMAAYLVPVDPGLCVIPLEKAILLIGRQADCDVSLTASRKISRKHCCIAIVNESVIVRDLGSTNGVSINGSRVDREAPLKLGDELAIGDVRFRLQKEATPVISARSRRPLRPSDGPMSLCLRLAYRFRPRSAWISRWHWRKATALPRA